MLIYMLLNMHVVTLLTSTNRHSSTYHATGPRGAHTRARMPSIERFSSCDGTPNGGERLLLPEGKQVTLSFQEISYVIPPTLLQKVGSGHVI